MYNSDERFIPVDLQPVCEQVLNCSILDKHNDVLFTDIFKDYFFLGLTQEHIAEVRGYDVRHIQRILRKLLFKLFLSSLRIIQRYLTNL